MTLTDQEADDLIKQKQKAEREKRRRDYNRLCRELAEKIGREGAGKTIPFEEYDKNHKLQIAINKENKETEE